MKKDIKWPHQILGYKEPLTTARKLGREIVNLFSDDPNTWIKYGQFEIKEERSPSGGLQALCIPMLNDHFRFVIFVHKEGQHPLRRSFLVAHETAHTFFYIRRENERPKRALLTGSDWEEEFCDVFAETVTGHNYKEVGLSKDHRRTNDNG